MNPEKQQQTMLVIPNSEWLQLKKQTEDIAQILNRLDIEKALSPKEYLGVGEFIEIYNMCRSQFEVLKKKGTFPTYKIGGKIYVKADEVRQIFLNARQ